MELSDRRGVGELDIDAVNKNVIANDHEHGNDSEQFYIGMSSIHRIPVCSALRDSRAAAKVERCFFATRLRARALIASIA